ncbi:hypothetical protein NML43_11460 [Rhodopseudomonas palustris]|uniref:hypothetical protein n=1 Tax=Rhodopseudomonas palustris TaxID=1076 RepID=UPI0020CFB611|nr:hypothetical protein [Rhodopseudomonas palustris]MCP9627706.1 hypothetical protein [Rhodopseudomonas palustris]
MHALDHASASHLDGLLRAAGLRLNEAQRRRLGWLAARLGEARLYQRGDKLSAEHRLIIVTDPLNSAGAELFYRSLRAGSVVVVPFGENPVFDFLKSKLTEYGTVGTHGADGPHEMWWGGVGAIEALVTRPAIGRLRVVSCYPRRGGAQGALRLQQAVERHQLRAHIEPIDSALDDRLRCAEKADFIARMWDRFAEPLLFVEAGADLHEAPLLPAGLGCDLAVHKWNRWEMSARTIYLGRTAAAEAFLGVWRQLAELCPTVWEGALLDQAWCLATSQRSLDTVWLPRSYHALVGDLAEAKATVVHDCCSTTADLGPDPSFAAIARAARRAGRTGPRDALVVMQSQALSTDSVAVILHDVGTADARAVAATIDAATSAFAAECGGFGRFELTLCAWRDEADAARRAARSGRASVLDIVPGQPVPPDVFASLAKRRGPAVVSVPRI